MVVCSRPDASHKFKTTTLSFLFASFHSLTKYLAINFVLRDQYKSACIKMREKEATENQTMAASELKRL